jgi:hypothetical protein
LQKRIPISSKNFIKQKKQKSDENKELKLIESENEMKYIQVLEESPKWDLLCEVLDEIEKEEILGTSKY